MSDQPRERNLGCAVLLALLFWAAVYNLSGIARVIAAAWQGGWGLLWDLVRLAGVILGAVAVGALILALCFAVQAIEFIGEIINRKR
jgi:hypothetical protein